MKRQLIMLLIIAIFGFGGCLLFEPDKTDKLVSNQAEVEAAKNALTFDAIKGENTAANNITGALKLTAFSSNGAQIAWAKTGNTAEADINTSTGEVKRGTVDTDITLTATISKGNKTTSKVFALTVKYSPNAKDALDLTNAKESLTYGAILAKNTADGNTKAEENIKTKLTLPKILEGGITVSWSTSGAENGTVLNTDTGEVTRGTADTTLALIATLQKNTTIDTKSFTLTIKESEISKNNKIIAATKGNLAFDTIKGENTKIEFVRTALNLVSELATSLGIAYISWSSDDTATINNNGTVTRDPYVDKKVYITATIKRGYQSDEKMFGVTVKGGSAYQDIADAKTALTFGAIGAANITSAIYTDLVTPLPVTVGDLNVGVTWSLTGAANDASIVTTTGGNTPAGTVTRGTADTDVTLTALIKSGEATTTKAFSLTIKESQESLDRKDIDSAKTALTFDTIKGNALNTIDDIKYNMSLPSSSAGVTIEWNDGNSNNIVSSKGDVTRSMEDKNIILTATLRKGTQSDTKSFAVTIKKKSVTSLSLTTTSAFTYDYYVGDTAIKTATESGVVVVKGINVVASYDTDPVTTGPAVITPNDVSGFTTSTAGTKTLTVTYGGKTASFEINVNPVVLNSISVTTTSAFRYEYYVGDRTLSVAGVEVKGHYNNGDRLVTIATTNVTGFDTSTEGIKELTVTYGGKTAVYNINVSVVTLNSISVTTQPSKTTYYVGDKALDITGLEVTGRYNNGDDRLLTITKSNITGFDTSTAGTKPLTVTYDGKTTTFNISVVAVSLQSIAVTAQPTKTTYNIGDATLYLDGIVVTGTYSNGTASTVIVTASNITGFDTFTAGDKTLTITYGGKTAAFTIKVIAPPAPDMIPVASGNITAAGISISSSIYMAKYDVTQSEFQTLMGYNPSYFTNNGTNKPVEGITWYEAILYCNKLSEKEHITPYYNIQEIIGSDGALTYSITERGNSGYRLPTSAEFEYAARGGASAAGAATNVYSGSSTVSAVAWYSGNAMFDSKGVIMSESNPNFGTHTVGGLAANDLGLYDMSGNVWKWTNNITKDANGKIISSVLKGGSWLDDESYSRVGWAGTRTPEYYDLFIGFRICRTQ